MKDHWHYEEIGNEWVWYRHSWTDGKNSRGDYYLKKYYCTNGYGEGVFVVYPERNERKQILGTCQFSLVGLKDPKRAIRRFMKGASK